MQDPYKQQIHPQETNVNDDSCVIADLVKAEQQELTCVTLCTIVIKVTCPIVSFYPVEISQREGKRETLDHELGRLHIPDLFYRCHPNAQSTRVKPANNDRPNSPPEPLMYKPCSTVGVFCGARRSGFLALLATMKSTF